MSPKKGKKITPKEKHNRFIIREMQKKLNQHEMSLEYQRKEEEQIEADKNTYLRLIEYANEIWDNEIKSINCSELNRLQQKEYRAFGKKWKILKRDLNWYNREIQLRTNTFLDILGNTLENKWGKYQLSDNKGFVYEDYYGVIERPSQCKIPTKYQSCFFDLIQLFSLFSLKVSEITCLCLDVKHFFNLESEALKQFEEYVKKMKRKRNDRENYKPLEQIKCAEILKKAGEQYAANRVSYLKCNNQKYRIPRNEYVPDLKSLERKIQRWDAALKRMNGSKPPPYYSRYRTEAEFKTWAEVYEAERYRTWEARQESKKYRKF